MKKTMFLIFLTFALFVLFYFFYRGEKIKFSIDEGQTASKIAENLKKEKIILSSFWFKALVKISGSSKKIMPGEYELNKYTPHELVLWKITHSIYISDMKITIPEGWRSEQIAERLKASGVIKNEKEFLKIVKEEKLEGYLFPSTYHFKKNMREREVINILKSEFDNNIKPIFDAAKLPQGMDSYKALIVASIVEREAVIDTERPLIAAVYLNRVKKGMPLEADPTVQYALGYWKKNLSYADLKFPSPYNTYYVSGLPPGPICNPGVKSAKAVAEPADIDALYFVADRKGRHVFNNNFEEHKKAIKRIKALYQEK
ncbi:MAG: endolytic transglycosylase MltG [Elusimicrobia bacterium]|nr:endolytic transglycosylase MltG [Elusimicrobiota bacterium]